MISLQIGLCKVKTNLMTIITEFYNKIKLFMRAHIEEVGISIIILMVGISSFFLGKYSVIGNGGSSDIITFTSSNLATTTQKTNIENSAPISKKDTPDNKETGEVVASKNGTRYYLPWCATAQRILDKNKVFFASALEAEKAGFTKALNCKGM